MEHLVMQPRLSEANGDCSIIMPPEQSSPPTDITGPFLETGQL